MRCHTSIGVLGAASVAAGLRVPGGVGQDIARLPAGDRVRVEHPTGFLEVDVHVDPGSAVVRRTAVVRTARKIFDGAVFPRSAATAPIPAQRPGGARDSAAR